MKAKPCEVEVNTKYGHICQRFDAKSIREGIKIAKASGGFYYRIYIGQLLVAKGYC